MIAEMGWGVWVMSGVAANWRPRSMSGRISVGDEAGSEFII
jgi:hypothetical protein